MKCLLTHEWNKRLLPKNLLLTFYLVSVVRFCFDWLATLWLTQDANTSMFVTFACCWCDLKSSTMDEDWKLEKMDSLLLSIRNECHVILRTVAHACYFLFTAAFLFYSPSNLDMFCLSLITHYLNYVLNHFPLIFPGRLFIR